MKKRLIPMCFVLAMMLSGCASGSETLMDPATTAPMASKSPTMMPSASPTTDMAPDAAPTDPLSVPMASAVPEAQGVTTVQDARKAIEQIEDELEKLSEVDDAQVVIAGNDAAVALAFEPQYQAGIDQRLHDIVKERIDGVITGVKNVAITDDTGLFDELEALGERLEGASDMADIQNELNAIINKIGDGLSPTVTDSMSA